MTKTDRYRKRQKERAASSFVVKAGKEYTLRQRVIHKSSTHTKKQIYRDKEKNYTHTE